MDLLMLLVIALLFASGWALIALCASLMEA
jgi:hypothetical protein